MIKVRRIIFLSLLLLAAFNPLHAIPEKGSAVNWITPDELQALAAASQKPVIVDVYTSWCYYCRVMDNTTWKNDSVAAYLQSNYYTVKLNAENKDPYSWEGKTYNYEPKYKINMLAVKLLGGNMVYPSTIIIPVKGEPEILKGAFSAKDLEMILKFYGERLNETTTPEKFMKTFSGKWK